MDLWINSVAHLWYTPWVKQNLIFNYKNMVMMDTICVLVRHLNVHLLEMQSK